MTSSQTWSDHSWSGVTGRITSLAWNFVADPERKWGWNVLIGLLLLLPWITICLLITILFMIWWMTRSRHALAGALSGIGLTIVVGLILIQRFDRDPETRVTENMPILNRIPNKGVEEYIDTWKDLAISKMKEHGIPASIILAQASLESRNGESQLTRNGHNHFGIKCHGWTGKRSYHTDDKKDECFRNYPTDEASFEDYCLFLEKNKRYDFLFDLDKTDYEGWAEGLKKAGFATDDYYVKKLIRQIKTYDLDRFDHE